MRGLGSLYRQSRSNYWWMKYYHRGKAIRESTGTGDRTQAERILRRRLGEREADRMGLQHFVGPEEHRLTIQALVESYHADYCTRKNRPEPSSSIRSHSRQILDYFGKERATRVDEDRLATFVAHQRKHGYAPATINRQLEILRGAFRLATRGTRRRLAVTPHIPRLEEDNIREGFFEREEFEALLLHLPDYLRDFATFAFWTGMRRGEIARLTWAHVDRSRRALRLRHRDTKNRESRPIKLVGELWSIIERRWSERVLDGERIVSWVFHKDGVMLENTKSLYRDWHAACRKAGIPGRLLHDFRRTAVRNMVDAGVAERWAMAISGHKTRAIFDRYNIVAERDIEAALEMTQRHVLNHEPRPAKLISLEEAKKRS